MAYTHVAYTNSKRTLQARKVSKDVVVGIILGLIAVIASAVVVFLLLRLNKQWRIERRAGYRVDLLGAEAGDSSIPAGGSEKVLTEKQKDKPLPPIPMASSAGSYPTVPGNGYTQTPMNEAPVVRQPSEVWSRPGNMSTSDGDLSGSSQQLSLNLSLSPLNIPTPRLPTTPAHTRTSTASSIGNFWTYGNSPGSGMSKTSNIFSNSPRGQLTIANATDADVAIDRSQSPHPDLPPYTISQVRGRVPPFPAKRPQPKQLRSILKPVVEDRGEGMSSYATANEKQVVWEMRPTSTASYMVQIPIPGISRTPASPVQPQRARTPLTLTTSRPVSDVVIEDTGSIRRPNGSRGKGRMVTMSVLVDDSDNSGSEHGGGGRDSYQGDYRASSISAESRDVLGEVLKGYTADLPPYTPIHEDTRVP